MTDAITKIPHEIPKPDAYEPRMIFTFFYPDPRRTSPNGITSESFSLDTKRGDAAEVSSDGTYRFTIAEKPNSRSASITVRPAYLWVEQFEALVKVRSKSEPSGTPQTH